MWSLRREAYPDRYNLKLIDVEGGASQEGPGGGKKKRREDLWLRYVKINEIAGSGEDTSPSWDDSGGEAAGAKQ